MLVQGILFLSWYLEICHIVTGCQNYCIENKQFCDDWFYCVTLYYLPMLGLTSMVNERRMPRKDNIHRLIELNYFFTDIESQLLIAQFKF